MKLLITSVPWTDTTSPTMAPALLKAECVKKGIDTSAIDLNQEVLHYVKTKYPDRFDAIQSFAIQNHMEADPKIVHELVEFMASRILHYKPTHIALSFLTYASQFLGEWLCFYFKKNHPYIKIIIGGAGVFNTLGSNQGYGDRMLEQKQIDYYIRGDGDDILSYLVETGDVTAPGINKNNWQQLDTLDGRPFPMYDDYDWSLYENKSLGIVGSRGCVRKCSFCDIHAHWNKFQWRSAEDIFAELIYQKETAGVTKFKFQDSLINGNGTVFMKLMRLLSAHNSEHPNNKITWTSFFIFRPKSQMTDDDWKLIGDSAELLIVGVESLVDHVRQHMRKKFTNVDLEYCLSKCKEYKIKVGMLLIVGYVIDNEATHQEACQWFEKNKQFAKEPIEFVNFGGGLGILPNTEIFRRQKEFGIVLNDVNFDHDWYKEDGSSTPELRMRWIAEQKKACRDAGFYEVSTVDNHLLMEQLMND